MERTFGELAPNFWIERHASETFFTSKIGHRLANTKLLLIINAETDFSVTTIAQNKFLTVV